MVGREVTATEIGKHSQLIKSAQEDMATMDVLVCGQCLTVCHFIEDFEKHKQTPCSKENNNIRECKDTKPKIWAFLLWKATQLHNNKNNNNGTTTPNSWSLYQTWIKMDESVRDTWVMAGRTIQSFSKVGQGGLQEMPVKITKTVVNNNAASGGIASDAGGIIRKPLQQTKPQIANVKTPAGKLPVNKSITDAEMKNEVKLSGQTTSSSGGVSSALNTPTNQLGKFVKKSPLSITGSGVSTPMQGKVNTLSLQSPKLPISSRRATRTSPNSDETMQENVEKIVAKRFNPRRKMHEYLVKWDGRPHDQNTWEPLSHLDQVQNLLDIFEKQLARQKENRAALQAKQGSSNNTSPIGSTAASSSASGAAGTIASTGTALTKAMELKKSDGGGGSVGALNKTTLTPKPTTTKTSPFFKSGSTGAAVTVGNAAITFSPPSVESTSSTKQNDTILSTRPTRTSKIKAMDQVKQWVSNETPATSMDSTDNADDSISQNSINSSGGGGGLKRKFNDSMEDLDDELNTSDTPSATAATIEDLEEDLIPSHTVKRMKNGTGVSVESKLIRMNGTNARGNPTSFSGESLPVGPKSAEVIITKEKGVSGVVRKPGFNAAIKTNSHKTEAQIRVLSKEESAVMSTGIVRTSKSSSSLTTGTSHLSSSAETSPVQGTSIHNTQSNRQTQLQRLGFGNSSRSTTTATTPINQRTQMIQRTSTGTIIQRKTFTPGGGGVASVQRVTPSNMAGRHHNSQLQSSGGRMIIPRSGGIGSNSNQGTMMRTTIGGVGNKAVTPEQKILQLSKSGDLKVTKKIMTREDAVAQRLGTQRQQQMQRQQQSQIQIQKVQQLAPPNSTRSVSSVSVRKRSDGTYTAHEEGKIGGTTGTTTTSQAQLCPITGKVLGREENQPSAQHLQDQMLTAAAAAAEQQQQQEQLELQQQQQQHEAGNDEQTLLLTSDQLLTNEDGSPLLVTGEDGTVYQVAGKNAEGQTVLITQGPDGEQHFAYVATTEGDENQVLTLDNAVAEAVSQLPGEHQQQTEAGGGGDGDGSGGEATVTAAGGGQFYVKTTQEDGTTHMVAMTEAELQQHPELLQQQQQIAISEAGDSNTTTSDSPNVAVAGSQSAAGAAVNQLCIETGEGGDGQEANIPAEVVQAELPSPGGTRRVVLLLQDGTFMMTEMQDDEFNALNIAA